MRSRRAGEARFVRVVAVLLAAALAGCGPAPYAPGPSTEVEVGDPADVEAVLLLVGDAGQARVEHTPLVHRLRAEVERWSALLPGDSSVAVAFLGDNIYPVGLRPRDHPDFPRDSARLHAQIWTVSGPEALADGTPGLFLPGNHDWGSMGGAEGRERLARQERHLRERSRSGGPAVSLVPGRGTPGPVVVELGDAARLVLLDTEWWLQSESPGVRNRMLAGLEEALRGAGDRPVVVAAHHPFATGGPHGERSLLHPFGLLSRSGAVIQDLSAEPFQELLDGLARVFREAGPPLVYAAGHDHSLQVIRAREDHEPAWMLVSGSGSKLTGVTEIPGMAWADRAPGYMRILFRRGGRVELYVERVPEEFQRCEEDQVVPPRALSRCVEEGVEAFSTGYSARLR